MGKVLGIVASDRRLGNSEVLVKEALFGAREEGAEVELLRLSDYRLENCRGCMSCVFKKAGGARCAINDDAPGIYDKVLEASGIIIGAPTYFLGPVARIKTLIDRSMMVAWREALLTPRWAATIAVAGLPGWDALAAPILSELALVLGGRIVGSMNAYAPGPGQVLVDPDNAARAHDLGRRVATGHALPVPAGHCPICRGTIFTPAGFSSDGHAVVDCPLCRVKGEIRRPSPMSHREVEIVFDPETVASNRWTPENMRHHFVDWVVPTREMFLRDLQTVKRARKRYEEPLQGDPLKGN